MIGRRAIIALMLITAVLYGSAFGVSITASVDRQEVGLGDPITLKITLIGGGRSLPEPTLPNLSDFEIYSSGRSQNISIINGAFSSSLDIGYTLVPKRVGDLIIGPITVRDKDGMASSEPIKIKVVQQQPAISSNQGQRSQQAQKPGLRTGPPQKGGDFFIDQFVTKSNPFVGEQVTLTFRFYQGVNLWDQPTLEWPKYAGFTVEDLQPNSRYYEVVRGRRYLVTEIKRALFPISSGKITIDTPKLTIKPDDFGTASDPFNFFDRDMKDLFKRGQPKILTADPITLNVRSFPEPGKPAEFGGAVGKFSINVSTDKDSVGVDEPITLKVILSGTGNIRSISLPRLPDLPDFRVYDSGNTESVSNSGQVISGTKSFEQAVIPKTSGNFTIPSIAFCYFDPNLAGYKIVSTPPIKITASGAGLADVGGAPKNIIGTGRQSLGYIITDFPTSKARVDLAGSFWFWFLQAVPLFGIGAAILYRRHSDKLLADRGYARRIGAGKRVRSIFKTAAIFKSQGNTPSFYAALHDAILGYVADRLNLSKAGLTLDNLKADAAIPGDLKNDLVSFLETCQTARFAPGGGEQNHADSFLAQASDLVDRLEKML